MSGWSLGAGKGKEGGGRSAEGQRRQQWGKAPIDRVRGGRDVSKGNREGTQRRQDSEDAQRGEGDQHRQVVQEDSENEKCPLGNPGGFRLGRFS